MSAGCASEQAAVQRPVEGDARWEAVVLPEQTDAALADVDTDGAWWNSRRDPELAVRMDGPMLATDEWPQPEPPSLDRWRSLTLPARPETVIYFRNDGPRHRDYRRW